jgi:hypothetical protein
MIFLGKKDGRKELNAGKQTSLRRNGTFWQKHDKEHHPQATISNNQGISSYMQSEK